ncbi:MAG TPA: sigma-70 family RNA polymerase sigma factor [Chthonomonadaceae bacterium]|nr:sigma-70 family RNA polymerase sigma factor [Chthonomonadaceae bacterium]
MKHSDRSLVLGCQAGDRQAWETLILRYERLIYGIALRSGLSEDDAADVFQTVCLRLLENLEKLRDDGHLKGWIILTTKHEAWRVHRMKRRQQVFTDAEAEDSYEGIASHPAQDPLPLEALIHLEDEHMIRMGIDELGDNCQLLLRLLYHSDPPCSYAQIAHQMNISEGAIGPTRARCLQKLKKILIGMGF